MSSRVRPDGADALLAGGPVRARRARREVNCGRLFVDEGQFAASAVEVTVLGIVDQFAQQGASATEVAHDRCHALLVAAPLPPSCFMPPNICPFQPRSSRTCEPGALCPPASAAVHERRSRVATARRLRGPSRTTGTKRVPIRVLDQFRLDQREP